MAAATAGPVPPPAGVGYVPLPTWRPDGVRYSSANPSFAVPKAGLDLPPRSSSPPPPAPPPAGVPELLTPQLVEHTTLVPLRSVTTIYYTLMRHVSYVLAPVVAAVTAAVPGPDYASSRFTPVSLPHVASAPVLEVLATSREDLYGASPTDRPTYAAMPSQRVNPSQDGAGIPMPAHHPSFASASHGASTAAVPAPQPKGSSVPTSQPSHAQPGGPTSLPTSRGTPHSSSSESAGAQNTMRVIFTQDNTTSSALPTTRTPSFSYIPVPTPRPGFNGAAAAAAAAPPPFVQPASHSGKLGVPQTQTEVPSAGNRFGTHPAMPRLNFQLGGHGGGAGSALPSQRLSTRSSRGTIPLSSARASGRAYAGIQKAGHRVPPPPQSPADPPSKNSIAEANCNPTGDLPGVIHGCAAPVPGPRHPQPLTPLVPTQAGGFTEWKKPLGLGPSPAQAPPSPPIRQRSPGSKVVSPSAKMGPTASPHSRASQGSITAEEKPQKPQVGALLGHDACTQTSPLRRPLAVAAARVGVGIGSASGAPPELRKVTVRSPLVLAVKRASGKSDPVKAAGKPVPAAAKR
eukprot:RCo022905